MTTHTAVPIRLDLVLDDDDEDDGDDGEASGSSLASSVDERAWWYWFTMPHSSHEVASRLRARVGRRPTWTTTAMQQVTRATAATI